MTLTSHWGSWLFLCWNNCCSVIINIELCSSGSFLSLQSKRIKTSWLQRCLLSECLKITNHVVSLLQLAVEWVRSYATQKRSRERSQCSPHRCSYRHPNRKEPIFLPRRLCCSTWRLLCQPAKFKCPFMESEYNPQKDYREFQTLTNTRANLLICGCMISSHRSWDLNKICFKSGVPIIENVMIERVSTFFVISFLL